MLINITTKFSKGDKALKFNPSTNKLEEFVIEAVNVLVKDGKFAVSYRNENIMSYIAENQLFASKEEFIAQL